MATHIRPLEIEVLCTRLQADFGALIAGQGGNDVERERNFFTRARCLRLCSCKGLAPPLNRP